LKEAKGEKLPHEKERYSAGGKEGGRRKEKGGRSVSH